MGRAYLAYGPDQEREGILRRVRKTDKPADRLAHEPRRLETILAETRRRGFGCAIKVSSAAFMAARRRMPQDAAG